jgi:hypothetical protein
MTTTEDRCTCCDLPLYSCGRRATLDVAQPRTTAPLSIGFAALLAESQAGRWFLAEYPGDCAVCGDEFKRGEEIRATGTGEWQGRDCCGTDGCG